MSHLGASFRGLLVAGVTAMTLGMKMEYVSWLSKDTLDCPKARRGDARWRFSIKGDDVRPPQLGELYYLACEDGRKLGVAFVQPRVNPQDPASSDFLVTIADEATRIAWDKRPCGRSFVYESSEPSQCLVELDIPGVGMHLRRLLYTLPFGLGDAIRSACVPLDSQVSSLQDFLEILMLSALIAMVCIGGWASAAPRWAECCSGQSEPLGPGAYRTGALLVVTTAPGGGLKVGEIEVGTDVQVLEVQRVDAGPTFGRIASPAEGWLQLRSGRRGEADFQRSFVLGAAPLGVQVPEWTQLFGEVLLMAVGFAFTFTSLIIQLLKIIPRYAQLRATVWITFAYVLVFGIVAVFSVWSKGCRHLAFHISLRQGKLFLLAPSFFDKVAFQVSCIGYGALAISVFAVVQMARARGDLDASMVVLEYWAFLSLLIFNALCFAWFHLKESQAKDGICIIRLSKMVEDQRSTTEVHCNVSFSLHLVQEEGLVAAGRSGSENLMQVVLDERDEKAATHGFGLRDVPWFNSFISRHVEPHSKWSAKVGRLWPPLIVVLLAYQTLILLGVCMQRNGSRPALLNLSELTGSLYPAFAPDHQDLSLFIDKDATSLNLYVSANPADTSSLTLDVQGNFASSTTGILQTRHAVEPGYFPPVLNYDVGLGPDTSRYTLHVQPVFLIVRSLTLHGKVCDSQGACTDFTRCIPWSWARSGAITIPEAVQNLQLEVAVAEHILGVPVKKGYPGRTYTTYQAVETDDQCKTLCRGDRSCVTYKKSQKGCYCVHIDDDTACHPLGEPPRADFGKFGSSLDVHPPAAQVCKKGHTDPWSDSCVPMAWELESQTFSVALPEASLNWVDHETDILLGLDSMMGGSPTSEHIRLRSGQPDLNMLMVYAEGASVRVIRSSEPLLTVELSKIDKALDLYLAALPSDAAFKVRWSTVDGGAEPVDKEPPKKFAECDRNARASRYQVCGGREAAISVMVHLDPLKPLGSYTLELIPEDADGKNLFRAMSIPVRITTQADVRPMQLLARPSCELPSFSPVAPGGSPEDFSYDCAEYPCGYPREVVEGVAQNCFSDRMLKIVEAFLTYPQHRGAPAASVLVKLGMNKDYNKIREKWFAPGRRDLQGWLPQFVTLREYQLAAAEHKAEVAGTLKNMTEDLFRNFAKEDTLTFVKELANVVRVETFGFTVPVVFNQLGTTGLWDLVHAAAVTAKSEAAVRALAAWLADTPPPVEANSWVLINDRLPPLALQELAVAVELLPALAASTHVSIYHGNFQAMDGKECADKLMTFLGKFKHLTTLTMEDCGLGEADNPPTGGGTCIAEMGSERWREFASDLTMLKLNRNGIKDADALVLAKYVDEAMPRLEILDLADTKITDFRTVSEIAAKRSPQIVVTTR